MFSPGKISFVMDVIYGKDMTSFPGQYFYRPSLMFEREIPMLWFILQGKQNNPFFLP